MTYPQNRLSIDRHLARIILVQASILATLMLGNIPTALSQQAVPPSEQAPFVEAVQPMGRWVEFKTTTYSGAPILVHLRTGYERAMLMPEPIRLLDDNQALPNCAVVIDSDVVGFSPEGTFARKSLKFVGLDTGAVYDLHVRASTKGLRQPIQVKR